MTQLDPSPVKVAQVQAVFSLAAFLFGLPAGALADLLDRRWVLLGALGSLMIIAGILGLVTLSGAVTPNCAACLDLPVWCGRRRRVSGHAGYNARSRAPFAATQRIDP